MKRHLLITLIVASCLSLQAQKQITEQSLIWYGYFLNLQFNDKWRWQTEFQERHFIRPTAQHQFLIRTHVHRALGKGGWEVSAGMCFFMQHPNDPKAAVKLMVPELRPHVEVAYKQTLKYFTLDHRYRVEARFFHQTDTTQTALEDGFDFGNFRFRYRLQMSIPVWKIDDNRALRVKVNDEIHLNAGSRIVRNVFEQNRLYAGLSIDPLPLLTFDVGYLHWFQQRPTGDFYSRHILRFTVYQDIIIKKAKRKASAGKQ